MKRQSSVYRIVGGAVCCVVVGLLVFQTTTHSDRLPPTPSHEKLPVQFDAALNAAHARIREQGNSVDGIRSLARLYQSNRFYQEAEACYEIIRLKSGGLSARDHYYLADIALTAGDLDRAQTELHQVLKFPPPYLPARIALAEVLFKSGQSDAAAREYATISELDHDNIQAAIGLARIELQQQKTGSAVTRLEHLMAVHPETTLGADLLAHELSRRGEAARATALTKGTREKREPVPADPWLAELLADSYDGQRLALRCEDYIMANQVDQALPLLAKVQTLDPKSWIPQVLKGWSLGKAHHYTEAVLAYTKALEIGGEPGKICPMITSLLIESGQLNEAARLAAVFYAKEPESVPILIAYAEVAARQGDEKTARVLLPRLLEKEPYLYLPNMNYANLLWAAGDRDGAVKCLARVAVAYPKDVVSRGLLGEYFLGKADPLAAIAPLEQALQYVAADISSFDRLKEMLLAAHGQVAESEAKSGRFAQAIAHYDSILKLNPGDLDAYAGTANCLVQLKDFKQAALYLTKLASYAPANPTILLSLGDVLYRDGDVSQARASWQRATELVAAGDSELRDTLRLRLSGQGPPEF